MFTEKNRGFPKKSLKSFFENKASSILEEYMQTEQYNKEKLEWDTEFKDFVLYGKPTTWFDNSLLKEITEHDGAVKIETLSIEEIVERFGDVLTEKDIENLKKLRDANT